MQIKITDISNIYGLILALFCIIFIVFDITPPLYIATIIDTMLSKIAILFILIYLFIVDKAFILGILVAWAFYILVKKSAVITGKDALNRFLPAEVNKYKELSAYNQFPYTLEQEMVSKLSKMHFNNGHSLADNNVKYFQEPAFKDAVKVNAL